MYVHVYTWTRKNEQKSGQRCTIKQDILFMCMCILGLQVVPSWKAQVCTTYFLKYVHGIDSIIRFIWQMLLETHTPIPRDGRNIWYCMLYMFRSGRICLHQRLNIGHKTNTIRWSGFVQTWLWKARQSFECTKHP